MVLLLHCHQGRIHQGRVNIVFNTISAKTDANCVEKGVVMKYKFTKRVVSIIVLILCSVSYASKGASAFETKLFAIYLPKEFVLLPSPDDQNRKKDNFTYTFIEGNKERKKSIILIIAGDRRNNANQEKKDLALFEATSVLRNIALKSKCKGLVSDISSEVIGNTKSLFFDRTNQGCIFSVEEYWSVIV